MSAGSCTLLSGSSRNRSNSEYSSVSVCRISFDVCLIFFGGADDREALAYVTRMVSRPAAKLTVIRIYSLRIAVGDSQETMINSNALNEFKIKTYDNRRVTYREAGAKDSTDTAAAIGKLNNQPFHLILFGRGHDKNSILFRGFSEWSELPELGVVGEMLISSDFKSDASILDEMVSTPNSIVKEICQ